MNKKSLFVICAGFLFMSLLFTGCDVFTDITLYNNTDDVIRVLDNNKPEPDIIQPHQQQTILLAGGIDNIFFIKVKTNHAVNVYRFYTENEFNKLQLNSDMKIYKVPDKENFPLKDLTEQPDKYPLSPEKY